MLSIETKARPVPRDRRGARPVHRFALAVALPAMIVLSLPAPSGEVARTAADSPAAPAPAAVSPPVMPAEVVFESSLGEVLFPHNRHLGFGCAACHHQIHAGALETPHPDYMDSSWISCQVCHSAEPAMPGPYYKCALCHRSEPESTSDETLSAKVVIHQSCWKCHKSGTGVEASQGCGECHAMDGQQPEVSDG